MICPQCDTEFREGVMMCSDCGVPLVHELDEANGLVQLPIAFAADGIAELLDRFEKQGVPYVIEAGTALPLLIDPNSAGRIPTEWRARVWVHAPFEERAMKIAAEMVAEARNSEDRSGMPAIKPRAKSVW